MSMRSLFLLVALLICFTPRPVSAQTIDGYRLNVYPSGAPAGATPTTFFDFLNSAITCNLDPVVTPTAGVPINPTRATWDDPNNAGRICQWVDDGKGPLFSVPFGSAYEAGLQAFNDAGRGPESNRAPFSRLSAPATAPTGFHLRRAGS